MERTITDLQNLLKKLEDKFPTNINGNIWEISFCSDGSGELITPDEKALTIFNNVDCLFTLADQLMKHCTNSSMAELVRVCIACDSGNMEIKE